MSAFQYKAFISYSHQDERWAKWLHEALESYRISRRLRGGEIPEKLYPVFRDRDELSSAANLNENVRTALQNSESLIVICSQASAKSRWVNEEIRIFHSLKGGDRIFTMIVAGTSPPINIDLGSNEPGMNLQRREDREWVNYKMDGKVDFFEEC
jgi:hypothetical protein